MRDVNFTSFKAVHIGCFFLDRQKLGLVDLSRSIVPVVLIAFYYQLAIYYPFFQVISTIANEAARLSPFLATFFYRGFMNRRYGGVNQCIDKIRNRLAQSHFQSVSVNRFHAQAFWLGFTINNRLRIDNGVISQIAGVW